MFSAPSHPEDLNVEYTERIDELKVMWKPPSSPNGKVSYYKVFYNINDIPDPEQFVKRDFCKERKLSSSLRNIYISSM